MEKPTGLGRPRRPLTRPDLVQNLSQTQPRPTGLGPEIRPVTPTTDSMTAAELKTKLD